MATTERAMQEGLRLKALAVALQHPAISANQRNICTLLQVSKAWRAVVQQSAAGLTNLVFVFTLTFVVRSKRCFSKMVGLAEWLANNPQLVSSIAVCSSEFIGRNVAVAAADLRPIQQLLELALRTAAAEGGAQFCPSSYASAVPPTARLLGALPAASLTKLELNRIDSSNWYTAISHLSSLRRLDLHMGSLEPSHPSRDGCLREMGKLRQLTKLALFEVPVSCDLQLLPVQLQQLKVSYQSSMTQNTNLPLDTVVDLQHLTRLQQLEVIADKLAAGSSVPPNLISLQLHACWAAGAVAGLSSMSQVTSVELRYEFRQGTISSDVVHSLQQLPQLVELSLSAHLNRSLLSFAAAWQHLPLRSLAITALDKEVASQDFQQLVQHIGTATKLTDLEMFSLGSILDGPEDPKFVLCKHFTSLRRLQRLALFVGHAKDFVDHDMQHLSKLVTLTSLTLGSTAADHCIDAVSLSVLALTLTALKQLSVNVAAEPSEPSISSLYAVPALGRLTTLEYLALEDLAEADARRGLQLLTDLSRLTGLGGFEKAGTEALRAFWTIVRAHKSQHAQESSS